MDEVMQTTLANNIKNERLANNLSQDELAEMLGEYSVYVSAFEQGIEIPSLRQLVRMADIFDCSVDWLLGREKRQKRQITESKMTREQFEEIKKNIFIMVMALIRESRSLEEVEENIRTFVLFESGNETKGEVK